MDTIFRFRLKIAGQEFTLTRSALKEVIALLQGELDKHPENPPLPLDTTMQQTGAS